MIRFFRNLRRRLLSENSFRNYLLYAIGEIILVVIGILIALQVNNWNSERQERRVSENYLIKLSGELDMMPREYNARRPEVDRGRKEALQALEYPEDCGARDSLQPAFVQTLLTHQFMMKYPEFRNTYDEMISAGAFAGVEDPEVKSRLFQSYNALSMAQTQIDYFRDEVGRACAIMKNAHEGLRIVLEKP